MKRTVLATAALAAVLTGCSDGDAEPAAGPTAPAADSSTSATEEAQPSGPLEGTWQARITQRAYTRYVVGAGFSQRAAELLLENDEEYWVGSDFTLDLLGSYFQITGPDGSSWNSGTFALRGDRIVLDDEAPVGKASFRFVLDGDALQFSAPEGTGPVEYLAPGVPWHLAGNALWMSSAWHRVR